MTDEPDALPDLTPDQEADVRRLLADARHEEPIPAEVGERLDRVLAGLSHDEPGASGVAPVIDLAARRRRRNAAAVLAGAAAVVVTGFGIGQGIDVGSSDDSSDATSADAGADREGLADDQGAGGGSDSLGESQEAAPEATSSQPPLILSSKHLARDVEDQLTSYSATSGSVKAPPSSAFG